MCLVFSFKEHPTRWLRVAARVLKLSMSWGECSHDERRAGSGAGDDMVIDKGL